MRQKTYTNTLYEGYNRRRTVRQRAPLIDFVLDLHLIRWDGAIPPLHVLNEVLAAGKLDDAIGPAITWRPFQINEAEYAELVEALLTLDMEVAEKTHKRLSFERAVIDEELATAKDYTEWYNRRSEKLTAKDVVTLMEADEDPPHYLNTDLMLVSNEDPTVLVQALEADGVAPLWVQQESSACWRMCFETGACLNQPDSTIERLLAAIEALEGEARRLWAACRLREFDIGYQCGKSKTPLSLTHVITIDLLQRIAAVNGQIRITLYPIYVPPQQAEPETSTDSK